MSAVSTSPESEDRPPRAVPLFDADGALSREYLLSRGRCCRSGCRNCPYGDNAGRESGPRGGKTGDGGPPS